jgi:hypothetical protein
MKFGRLWPVGFCGLLFPLASALASEPDWLSASVAEPVVPRTATVAAIVLLYSGEVRYVSADHLRTDLRGAVKVINASGIAQARAALTYNAETDHILSARAWVVSADGKTTRTYGRSDFVDSVAQYNKYFWDAQRVLLFDGSDKVEVGGTVAWEVQSDSPSGVLSSSWSFAKPLEVVHGRFNVIPMPGGVLEWHATSPLLATPTAGAEPGSLLWEVSKLQPFPAGRPAGFLPNSMEVSVRCVPAGPAGRPKTAWRDEAILMDGVMGPRIDTAGEVKAQAEALVAGKSQRWDRIRALTEFTQRNIVYLAITLDKDYLAGYRPHPPAEVLRNRYGDCKDKATLLVSMLRAIGEEGYVVLLNAGNPAATSADWPSCSFNHAIVAVPADASVPAGWPVTDAGALGKVVIFDPTDSSTPLGILSGSDQGGLGLIVDSRQGMVVKLPVTDPDFSRVERRIRAQLGAHGELEASVEENFHGLPAAEIYGLRAGLGAERFKERLEARVHEATPLAQGLEWKDDWDAAQARYRLSLRFTSERYARPLGDDLLMVTPRLLPESAPMLSWRTRADGVVWREGFAVDEEVRLTMPEGYTVEEMPEGWTQTLSSGSGALSYRVEGREIVYRCQLSQLGGFYAKADYEALRLFNQSLVQAARRPVILKHAAAPASS